MKFFYKAINQVLRQIPIRLPTQYVSWNSVSVYIQLQLSKGLINHQATSNDMIMPSAFYTITTLRGIETMTELIFQDTDASKTWELRTCSKYPVDEYIQATSTLTAILCKC